MSIGYILWMIRGSVLVSTLLSSLPAWRVIDPLPILSGAMGGDDEDEETLESIIESESDDSDKTPEEFEPDSK